METPDGEWLHVEHFVPKDVPRLVIVFAHGFSSYAAPYRHVARALADRGYAVTTYDARGHGHSTGRRGYVEHFSDYTADLVHVLAIARSLSGAGVPFALVGHSQGASVVLDYVLSKQVALARPMPALIVVATPMLEIVLPVPLWKRLLDAIGGRLLPRFQISNGITGSLLTHSEDVRRAYPRDPLVHHVATPRWFREIVRAESRLRASAAELSVPTLLLTAGNDEIVSQTAQDDFVRATPPGLVAQRTYPSLSHELFLEPERAQVIDDMLRWIGERLDHR